MYIYIYVCHHEPLLEQLEAFQGYTIDGNHHKTSLAFADNLILWADNPEMTQKLLRHSALNMQVIGMTIAAYKCASFREGTIRDAWYISDTQLYLEGKEMIPSSATESALSYLGGHITPWAGLDHKDLVDQLRHVLCRLRTALLKPHQISTS